VVAPQKITRMVALAAQGGQHDVCLLFVCFHGDS
jgi:hypothetical protein